MFLDVPYGSVLPPSLMIFFYPNFTFRVPKSHKKPWTDGVGSQIWMAPLISNLCSLLPSTTNFYHYWKVIVSVLIVLSTISTSVNTLSTGVSIINANVSIIIKSIGSIIVGQGIRSFLQSSPDVSPKFWRLVGSVSYTHLTLPTIYSV